MLNNVLGTSLEPAFFDNPYPFFQPFTEAELSATTSALDYTPNYLLEEGIKDYMAFLRE